MGDQVIIGIEPLGARRIRDEIPNWILNRPASISGQIVLKKEPLDSFLGRPRGRRAGSAGSESCSRSSG